MVLPLLIFGAVFGLAVKGCIERIKNEANSKEDEKEDYSKDNRQYNGRGDNTSIFDYKDHGKQNSKLTKLDRQTEALRNKGYYSYLSIGLEKDRTEKPFIFPSNNSIDRIVSKRNISADCDKYLKEKEKEKEERDFNECLKNIKEANEKRKLSEYRTSFNYYNSPSYSFPKSNVERLSSIDKQILKERGEVLTRMSMTEARRFNQQEYNNSAPPADKLYKKW